MIKKEIVFQNVFGEEVTRTAFFMLSQEELTRLHSKFGKEVNAEDFDKEEYSTDEIVKNLDLMKSVIKQSYFETDETGTAVIRTPEAWNKFEQSLAYSTLVDELLSDEAAAKDFMAGLVSHIKNDKFQEGLRSSGIIE